MGPTEAEGFRGYLRDHPTDCVARGGFADWLDEHGHAAAARQRAVRAFGGDLDRVHRHLDDHPDDHEARLVVAELFEESGDARAAGYRALACLRRRPVDPHREKWSQPGFHDGRGGYGLEYAPHARLPADWLAAIDRSLALGEWWRACHTRREIEDAAAAGFACLPTARQEELLAGSPSDPTPPPD
jgi:uncharacterized protein (TIGR02996 family)